MTITEEQVRQSHRTTFQRFVTDPSVALVAVSFWGVFRLLPVRWASAVGGAVGYVAGLVMRKRNHIALVNLKIAFPQKTDAERRSILRRSWCHWGRFYAEMPHASQLFYSAEIVGMEHLKKIAKAGRGGLVCSAHIGNWELAVSQPLFDSVYLNPVYRRANNPWLDKLMFQRRTGTLIPKGTAGARQLVSVLRNGGLVVMLCDQKLREGIDVPFLGKTAKTAPAIATMALKFNTPIVMARSIRKPNGQFYVEVSKPLTLPHTGDINADIESIMIDINRIMEEWIRETPEQWLWMHRRFDKSEY